MSNHTVILRSGNNIAIGRLMEPPEQHAMRLKSDAAWANLSVPAQPKPFFEIPVAEEGPTEADDWTQHSSPYLTW